MTARTFRHGYFGWVLDAPFRIGGLPALEHIGSELPDLNLREGAVPTVLADPVWSSPRITIGADGQVLIRMEKSGRFLVREGRDIVFERVPATADHDLAGLVTSIATGVVLHQRAVLPLHASCVELAGRVFAFAGPAGYGKSTLAQALIKQGARLHSDDIAVVRFAADGRPIVAQGTVAPRLWSDSLLALGGDDSTWMPARHDVPKKVGRAVEAAQGEKPLAAVIRLKTTHAPEPLLTRLSGPRALMPLSFMVYRHRLGTRLGRSTSLFQDAMRLLGRAPIFELARPRDLAAIDQLGALVFKFLEQQP